MIISNLSYLETVSEPSKIAVGGSTCYVEINGVKKPLCFIEPDRIKPKGCLSCPPIDPVFTDKDYVRERVTFIERLDSQQTIDISTTMG